MQQLVQVAKRVHLASTLRFKAQSSAQRVQREQLVPLKLLAIAVNANLEPIKMQSRRPNVCFAASDALLMECVRPSVHLAHQVISTMTLVKSIVPLVTLALMRLCQGKSLAIRALVADS